MVQPLLHAVEKVQVAVLDYPGIPFEATQLDWIRSEAQNNRARALIELLELVTEKGTSSSLSKPPPSPAHNAWLLLLL